MEDPLVEEPLNLRFDPEFALKMSDYWLPIFEKYFRYKTLGLEHLPEKPFLMVGNHSGGVMCPDSYMWMARYHSLNRKPYMLGLGHDVLNLFAHTKAGAFVAKGGMIRATFDKARRALKEGYALFVYPGGDLENNRAFAKRNEVNFYGHTGYIRLALTAGVPIVPLVTIGAHETLFILWEGQEIAQKLGVDAKYRAHTFPISLAAPWGLAVGPMPFLPLPAQITSQILPPIDLSEYSPEDADNPQVVQLINRMVTGRMQDALNALAKKRVPFLGDAEENLPPKGDFWGDAARKLFFPKKRG